jgi:hypothetical protein
MAFVNCKKIIKRKIGKNGATSFKKNGNMSWTDEELDELIRKAASKAPNTTYQDSYFDEISHLLPKKKKQKVWWLILPSLVLLSIFISPLEYNKVKRDGNYKTTLRTKKLSNETNRVITNKQTQLNNNYDRQDLKLIHNQYSNKRLHDELKVNNIPLTPHLASNIDDKNEIEQQIKYDESLLSLELKKLNMLNSELDCKLAAHEILNKKNVHFLTLNTQIGLSSSWLKGPTLKPFLVTDIGLSYYRKYLNINAEVGLNLAIVIPQDMRFEKSSKVYGVRIKRFHQQLTYHSLVALDLPIQISKSFNRNKLSFSLAPQYVLGGVVSLVQTQNNQVYEKNRFILTKHGIQNIGLRCAIGYQYQFSDLMEIGVKFSAQMINPLNSNVLQIETNSIPIMGQLTLKKFIKIK